MLALDVIHIVLYALIALLVAGVIYFVGAKNKKRALIAAAIFAGIFGVQLMAAFIGYYTSYHPTKIETSSQGSSGGIFRFEHVKYLWLLTAWIPITLFFLLFLNWRKRSLNKFGKTTLISRLAETASSSKHWVKYGLLTLAFVFLVLGFANPQIGTSQEKVKRQGIDVVIAIDVSNSMLCEDVKPNRLMRAKNFISNFIDRLSNDRLGMIVFAGRAYLQMPLTADYSAGRMYNKTINTNLMPTQGTNVGEAIEQARQAFAEGENKHKALVIITDGEDNEGGMDEAIASAVKEGVKIFTIGVGDKGGPIPIGNDFKRDQDGNIVYSKMNEDMLRDIANKGNGKYFKLGSGKEEIDSIFKELGLIETKQIDEVVFADFDDQFQWCVLIAAVLLLLEWWLVEKKGVY